MDIIVIGGIAAGMSVAAKAKRENPNANVLVFEKEDYISFGACGLPYYLGNQFEDENEMFARTPEQIEKTGIQLHLKHEVVDVDFDKKLVTAKDLKVDKTSDFNYDKLMIATGATPIIPPIKGIESENVYTITKLYDVNRLKNNLENYKRIVIIGGGFIGVEVAEQLAHLNKEIHIVEAMDDIMAGPFDEAYSKEIKKALEEIDVKVHTSEMAQEFITEANHVIAVQTSNQKIEADAVIVSVGFRPNTSIFKDKLEMLGNGAIITNEYGQTSVKDVFSAGDCASIKHKFSGDQYIPLATYANKMGRIIGTNIATDNQDDWIKFNGALGSSLIKVGNYEAGSTGLTEKNAKDLGLNIKTTTIFANNHSNYYPNQEKIMIKLVYDAKNFVLYGAQVFGKAEAALRLHALTTAIYAGLTTKEIGFIDYAYAPPFASTWEAINIAANTAK